MTSVSVFNPYDGDLVGEVPASTPEEVMRLAEVMSSGNTSITSTERHDLLWALSVRLSERSDLFTDRIVSESGICRKDAQREVQRAAENLRVAAEEAERLVGGCIPIPARSGVSVRVAFTLLEPVGTVVAITPFNRPLHQVVVRVAPAVAADDRTIIKPSEKTPLSAFAFVDLMYEVGVPIEVVCDRGRSARSGRLRSVRHTLDRHGDLHGKRGNRPSGGTGGGGKEAPARARR